ncbi:hypothetical protein A3D73_00735 [Candidatus Uhrbacteria bacterium RIFCSPHIGHO2_02_FULL_60_44]|nr:MAG: hypothetical protein A3D73_00735 [Candidatus Uhrbacteria bacterium RIFCSPHIGHO2_02_FULL_60_44]
MCADCWPVERTTHAHLYIEHYAFRLLDAITKPLTRYTTRARTEPRSGRTFDALARLRIVRFLREPDESKLYNRSLIFFEEAKRRGIDIAAVTCMGRYVNEFRFRLGGRSYAYEGTPLNLWTSGVEMNDKGRVKTALQRAGIPVAEGRAFTGERAACAYGQALGLPLAVKPANGSLSQHVTAPVRTVDGLRAAVRLAKRYQPVIVVERFISGRLYRATVVGRDRVFVCRKEAANVVGDGISSIETLIQRKNDDARRGAYDRRNTTLHRIALDDALVRRLDVATIPSKGETVRLHEKVVLSQGCDIVACTDATHPDNRDLFLSIARLFETDLVGIDFICGDIARSYREQTCAVLETNNLPYLDMHQCPSDGPPDRVAEIVWDIVLERLAA